MMSDGGTVTMSEFRLQGRNALITGGATGIGFACVQWFAKHGCRVAIADRDEAGAQVAARTVGGVAIALDVRQSDAVEKAVETIEERLGNIYVLVNCAGVLQNPLPPRKLTIKEWDLVTDVDLRGTYLMCAAVGQRMAARSEGGSIVNIGSIAGMRSGPLHAYGPAKAAVIALTECLAAEWGRHGVRVNTVSPGFTETPSVAKSMELGILEKDVLVQATALGRLINVEEIAAAVGFLASPLASAITGVNLPVDAGYLVATPWQAYGGLRPTGNC